MSPKENTCKGLKRNALPTKGETWGEGRQTIILRQTLGVRYIRGEPWQKVHPDNYRPVYGLPAETGGQQRPLASECQPQLEMERRAGEQTPTHPAKSTPAQQPNAEDREELKQGRGQQRPPPQADKLIGNDQTIPQMPPPGSTLP